ncbi:hypothetical protein [Myroides fluvii]|uniref:hypothetical protein n=1 Tax=Myroides fluvii TaxID=2572594 RepID=UPI00131BB88D|nr:hypothetical protein [Myroides fluvii]
MKKRYIGFAGLGLVLALGTQQVHAQQGFGTDKPAKSAAVDIQSSKRGLLIPRVDLVATTNGVTPINDPKQSLMVYNQATNAKGTATGVTPGYYYWDTDRWVRFAQQGDISAINLEGDVTGPTNATIVGAIQGIEVSNVNPTANQVLTFDATEGKWKAVSLTENNLTSSKGITGTGITVGGETNGANSTLKDVTLAITPGKPNFVMVTNADGNGTTWVDQSTIAPATTNELTKEANSNGNTLVSKVNGVESSVALVEGVSNTITGTTIQTTVNGVVSASVDLKDAIQAGQKITTVVDGVNTTVTSSVNPAGSNTTEYKVNVSNEDIQAAQKTTSVVAKNNKVSVVTNGVGTTVNNTEYTVGVEEANLNLALIGGSLNPGQIAPGTEGQVLTTVPPKAGTTTPSVEWKAPATHENIYTHDGTLVHATGTTRTVDFGSLINMTFKKATQSHQFTYDANHTGINMFGDKTSSIGLISNVKSNNMESKLKLKHDNELSEIIANSDKGLRIGTEHLKNIDFTTYDWATGSAVEKKIMTLKADGGVQVVNINTPAFKGGATDNLVVADATGVLKTVERKKMAPQFFYMPAVIFNTKTRGTGLTRDLYQDYVNQFTTASGTAYNIAHGANGGSLAYDGGVIGSDGAPAVMEVYGRGELHYYVTYYDKNVFANISINANGELKYDIVGTATPASYMNIVFVIK